jgi:hypothetical protein
MIEFEGRGAEQLEQLATTPPMFPALLKPLQQVHVCQDSVSTSGRITVKSEPVSVLTALIEPL